MNRIALVVLANALLLLLTACPSKNSHQSSGEIIPVKGDPLVFIKGTQGDTESGLPLSLLSENTEWTIYSRGFRATKQEQPQATQEDLEEDNSAPDDSFVASLEESVEAFHLQGPHESNGQVPYYYFEPVESREGQLTFQFVPKDSRLHLTALYVGKNKDFKVEQVKVHHYSVKDDQSAFSVLVSLNSIGLDSLISFEFTRKQDTGFLSQKLDAAYNYMFGPGIKMTWDQSKEHKITICNQNSIGEYAEVAKESVLRWKEGPLENRLRYTVSDAPETCPPFSDLNTHSILHVKGWIAVYKEGAQLAFATMTPNFYSQNFVDGDVMFLESEWEEGLEGKSLVDEEILSNANVQKAYRITITHETGHLLGLHHQFDPAIPSMMGYKDVDRLTTYDWNAIQALYPPIEE